MKLTFSASGNRQLQSMNWGGHAMYCNPDKMGALGAIVLMGMGILAGCAIPLGTRFRREERLLYHRPEDIQVIGPAYGETERLYLFCLFPLGGSDSFVHLIREMRDKSQADAIIDFTVDGHLNIFPILPIVCWREIRIAGLAVKFKNH